MAVSASAKQSVNSNRIPAPSARSIPPAIAGASNSGEAKPRPRLATQTRSSPDGSANGIRVDAALFSSSSSSSPSSINIAGNPRIAVRVARNAENQQAAIPTLPEIAYRQKAKRERAIELGKIQEEIDLAKFELESDVACLYRTTIKLYGPPDQHDRRLLPPLARQKAIAYEAAYKQHLRPLVDLCTGAVLWHAEDALDTNYFSPKNMQRQIAALSDMKDSSWKNPRFGRFFRFAVTTNLERLIVFDLIPQVDMLLECKMSCFDMQKEIAHRALGLAAVSGNTGMLRMLLQKSLSIADVQSAMDMLQYVENFEDVHDEIAEMLRKKSAQLKASSPHASEAKSSAPAYIRPELIFMGAPEEAGQSFAAGVRECAKNGKHLYLRTA
ncbi:MAG: hypothetical protein JWR22_2467 [Herminiimonas sp.]|nr:hypothetical protein [Herminiimonas sp.]